jgi:hypothetical protein
MTVTGMNEAQTADHIEEAFTRWERHSKILRRVDLSLITAGGMHLRELTPAVSRLRDAEDRGADDEARSDLDILVVTTVAMVAPVRQEAVPGPGDPGPRGNI